MLLLLLLLLLMVGKWVERISAGLLHPTGSSVPSSLSKRPAGKLQTTRQLHTAAASNGLLHRSIVQPMLATSRWLLQQALNGVAGAQSAAVTAPIRRRRQRR